MAYRIREWKHWPSGAGDSCEEIGENRLTTMNNPPPDNLSHAEEVLWRQGDDDHRDVLRLLGEARGVLQKYQYVQRENAGPYLCRSCGAYNIEQCKADCDFRYIVQFCRRARSVAHE